MPYPRFSIHHYSNSSSFLYIFPKFREQSYFLLLYSKIFHNRFSYLSLYYLNIIHLLLSILSFLKFLYFFTNLSLSLTNQKQPNRLLHRSTDTFELVELYKASEHHMHKCLTWWSSSCSSILERPIPFIPLYSPK